MKADELIFLNFTGKHRKIVQKVLNFNIKIFNA